MGFLINTGPDALHFESGGVEIQQLHAVRTMDGIAVTFASGRNGPGIARIQSTGDGTDLSYRAPGSSVFGPVARCDVNEGDYRLSDGEDKHKYIRIKIYTDHIISGSNAANIQLEETIENEISANDVTESDASGGDVFSYSISLKNYSQTILSQVKAWLRESVVNLEISNDGAAWVSPVLESNALDMADITPGSSVTFYFRRTISAGSLKNPGILNLVDFSWTGG